MAKQQIPPFGLRMPPNLHEWVKAEAEKQSRSMNSQIVHVLKMQKEAEAQK